MYIGDLLQSGGIVGDIWKKGAKIASSDIRQASSILILGLGAGTAAKVFSQKWPKAKIIGVEIDKEVIRLGKKYFDLGQIPNLKTINKDAFEYVTCCMTHDACHFDLIIVDLYLGEKIPVKSESLTFLKNLKKLLSKNGIVIFNRLFWGKHKKEAKLFVQKTEKIFKEVKLVRTVANLLVICKERI